MEKYDYIVKSSEIRKLVEKRMYQKALQIIETMDVRKIKVLSDLSVFAEVYMQTEHYDEAEDILLRLREKSASRRIIYQLIKLAIKRKNIEDAEDYYAEFVEAAPRDADKFILRYRIDKMEGKDYPTLIASLQELKEYDYTEKWAYELAKIYHKAGMVDRCINECSDIILWFGEGVVVEKARMLREHYLGSESGIPEGSPLINTRSESDYLVQEELELQDEESQDYYDRDKQSLESAMSEEAEEEFEAEEEPEVEEVSESEEEPEEAVAEEGPEMESAISDEPEEELEEMPEAEESPEEEKASEEPEVMLYKGNFKLNEYQELFGRFYHISNIRLQVVNMINDMFEDQTPYSFAITGSSKCGKTTLAKSMIKLLYELNLFPYKKVAKINSEKLRDISLENSYEQLQDGYLIVEGAGDLKPEEQLQLIKMLRDLRGHALVILEDTYENIKLLYRNYPMLTNYIPETIKIEAYGKKELYDYALDFFAEKEFELEEDAEIILNLVCEELMEKEVAEERPVKLLERLEQTIENLERRGLEEVTGEKPGKSADDSSLNKIIAMDFGNV